MEERENRDKMYIREIYGCRDRKTDTGENKDIEQTKRPDYVDRENKTWIERQKENVEKKRKNTVQP